MQLKIKQEGAYQLIFIKMTKEKDKKLKKEIVKEIIIPEGIEVIIKDNMITMKKDSNELKRKVDPRISIKKEDNC